MRYKAIISDVDGTLVKSSPNALPSKKVKDAISKVIKTGKIHFSVASARPFTMLEYLIKDLDLVSPLILNNGAEIYNPGNGSTLWKSTIPYQTATKLYEILKEMKVNIDLKRQVLKNPKGIPSNSDVYKFFVYDLSNIEASNLIRKLRYKFPKLNFENIGSYLGDHLTSISISQGDATKQHAVLKFAELTNISTKEIIAIGDHYNDFPLFMACGLKIAMGNAVNELKEIADYVAPSVDENGIVDILEKFVFDT